MKNIFYIISKHTIKTLGENIYKDSFFFFIDDLCSLVCVMLGI